MLSRTICSGIHALAAWSVLIAVLLTLIAAPLLDLWPTVVIRTALPDDVLQGLVEPLRQT
jgi:hypothetical protein